MLLKRIILNNFRQFVGKQVVEFSTDPDKNVTVIIGENTSGKTTLAQAFTWVLYGVTGFTNKDVLNASDYDTMKPGEDRKVSVELHLKHQETNYIITRQQVYRREVGGIKASNADLTIAYKRNGQQEFIKSSDLDPTIKKILPRDMARYFFFDGERLEEFSKQISKGKSQEFDKAVHSLLGLAALSSALQHLKPTSKYSVIGSYNESLNHSSDKRIADYGRRINDCQDEIDQITSRIEEIDEQVEYFEGEIIDLQAQIKEYAPVEQLQMRFEKLRKEITSLETSKTNAVSALLAEYNNRVPAFFALPLIRQSLKMLSDHGELDKGIPDIHARTIDYLINTRKQCLCGTMIEKGTSEYEELIKILAYIPPQYIGTSINQFSQQSEIMAKSGESFFQAIQSQFSHVRTLDQSITEKRNELQQIDETLLNTKDVAALKTKLIGKERTVRELREERDKKLERRAVQSTERNRLESERDALALQDEKNRKIELFKNYAQAVYDEIKGTFDILEANTRQELEKTINDIFSSIFEGELTIKIDEKYNIDVATMGSENNGYNVDLSTAQKYSVIFAFIVGIIKMARKGERLSGKKEEDEMLISEPYPLVMDAPLSSFDKRRIERVCTVMPEIAEQVIIFIKDVDGEIAEQYMSSRIAKQYIFDKQGKFTTFITQRGDLHV